MRTKKYFVLMNGKRYGFTARVNSWRFANWLMNLNLWTYAKIHNDITHECIAINDRRGS